MAGIGFELRRLRQQGTARAWVQTYTIGAVAAVGPFLSSVVGLSALIALSQTRAELEVRRAFVGAVVWIFCSATIATGGLIVICTRYLADLLYAGATTAVADALFPMLATATGLLILGALPILWISDLSLLAQLCIVAAELSVGGLMLGSVYLNLLAGPGAIALIHIIGTSTAVVAGLIFLRYWGLEGLLFGYALGEYLIFALALERLVRGVGWPRRWDWRFLQCARKHPRLVVFGLLVTLGCWADKFLFWTSELAVGSAGIVTAPKYDSSIFLGFLTAQPAVVHFFVKSEDDLAERFGHYFDQVFLRESLSEIEAAAAALRRAVWEAARELLVVQGFISFLALVYAADILGLIGIPLSQIGMFRASVVGSLFLVQFQFALVLLLYLDRQREVLFAAMVLLFANTAGSYFSIRIGYGAYGFGYACACLAAAVAASAALARQLEHLEYFTFMESPFAGQRRAHRGLRARLRGGFGIYHKLGRRR